MKHPITYETLIKTYGKETLKKACSYFEKKKRHFTSEEIESKCREIKNKL